MQTKTSKQAVTLVLDTAAMQGPFNVRDVAEKACRTIKWESLSLTDQQEALMGLVMREIKNQMNAPLKTEIAEQQMANLPRKYWPVVDSLTKTICVSSGSTAMHVYTLLATADQWESYLELVDIMQARVRTARNNGRNIRDLLRSNNADSLAELLTQKAA